MNVEEKKTFNVEFWRFLWSNILIALSACLGNVVSIVIMGFAESGITLKRVEKDEFQQALEKMMENPDLVTLLRPLMAYDMGSGHQTRWIEAANDYTTQVLYRMGFQWPPTAADYVHRFVDTIVGFDYFTV